MFHIFLIISHNISFLNIETKNYVFLKKNFFFYLDSLAKYKNIGLP